MQVGEEFGHGHELHTVIRTEPSPVRHVENRATSRLRPVICAENVVAISNMCGHQLTISLFGTSLLKTPPVLGIWSYRTPAVGRQKSGMTYTPLVNGVSNIQLLQLACLKASRRFRHEQGRDAQGFNARKTKLTQPAHQPYTGLESLLQLLDLSRGESGMPVIIRPNRPF